MSQAAHHHLHFSSYSHAISFYSSQTALRGLVDVDYCGGGAIDCLLARAAFSGGPSSATFLRTLQKSSITLIVTRIECAVMEMRWEGHVNVTDDLRDGVDAMAIMPLLEIIRGFGENDTFLCELH